MTYTVAEVEAACNEVVQEEGSWFWNELDKLTLRGEVVRVEEVDSTGGMDEGSNASVTFRIGDQFFQKQGYYASHYGYDWDGAFMEVRPVEKTVIVYGPFESKD